MRGIVQMGEETGGTCPPNGGNYPPRPPAYDVLMVSEQSNLLSRLPRPHSIILASGQIINQIYLEGVAIMLTVRPTAIDNWVGVR